MYIYPYKAGSASVKKLKEALLDTKIIKLKNSKYKNRPEHLIINWGNSKAPAWLTPNTNIINKPEAVAVASNKLSTFTALAGAEVPTVPWTTDIDLARDWQNDGHKVFARHSLTGHSGDGIEVIEPVAQNEELVGIANRLFRLGLPTIAEQIEHVLADEEADDIPEAPLYTKGITNCGEYRVHIFEEEVILYQKKSRRINEDGEVETAEGEDADVRNLASNWVYRTGNLKRLERIEALAIDAVKALGLDFGAVDIIKDGEGRVYVLEVNSAPGLGNTDTLRAYVEALGGGEWLDQINYLPELNQPNK